MSEPLIMPIKPGAIGTKDRAALKRAGIIVFEHPNPDEVRLLRATVELDASDMLRCALQALASESGFQAEVQRKLFVKLLAAAATKEADHAH